MMLGAPIDRYCDFVRPAYTDRDPGHDFDHICRIIDRLPELADGKAGGLFFRVGRVGAGRA